MKHSEIIKEAKKLLWDGRGNGHYDHPAMICIAIGEVDVSTVSDNIKQNEIVDYISDCLGDWASLGGWLRGEKNIDWEKNGGYPALQEYRLRFMDELIRRYKRAGK